MLNDDGNENGKKYQLFLLAKKSFTSAARFLVHFFDVVLQHDNVRRLSYTSYIGNVVCAHHNFCCLCPWSLFFSLPLIVTSLVASISHFLTAFLSCFSSNKIRLFCFVPNALPLSLLSTPVKTKKCSQTRFCCCFFSLRSPGGHAMTRQKT